MADKKEDVVKIEVVGEKPITVASTKTATKKTSAAAKPAAKKEAAPKAEKAPAAPKAKAPAKKAEPKAEEVKTEAAAAATTAATEQAPEQKAPAKKATKKQAVKAPLYINGRYVVEKQLPAKPAKGAKPYAEAKKNVKVTLIKSTAGCLKDQQATVKALGLTKIRSTNVLPDNDAIRGMIFKVKHLVAVEEVK